MAALHLRCGTVYEGSPPGILLEAILQVHSAALRAVADCYTMAPAPLVPPQTSPITKHHLPMCACPPRKPPRLTTAPLLLTPGTHPGSSKPAPVQRALLTSNWRRPPARRAPANHALQLRVRPLTSHQRPCSPVAQLLMLPPRFGRALRRRGLLWRARLLVTCRR